MICDNEISEWCEASLCTIRDSKHHDIELKRAWQFACGSTKCQVCLLEDYDKKVANNHIQDMSDLHGQGSCDTQHSLKKACKFLAIYIDGYCPAEIWNVELPEEEAVTQVLKPT
jgi:hypothetical protein